jgi:hypothetical protein
MRRLSWIVPFVLLTASYAIGQEASPSATPPSADAHPAKVKVYTLGPGVTAPELLPPDPLTIPEGKCKKKMNDTVELSILIDAEGRARNIYFIHALGTDLDKYILQLVASDRFRPGTYDGKPVVVAASLQVNMKSCLEERVDDRGKGLFWVKFQSQPEQKLIAAQESPEEAILLSGVSLPIESLGGKVSPPVQINNVPATFTKAARQHKYSGICILSLNVDIQGMPQNIHAVKPLDYGMTENAIDAVRKYRFKPAMKDGTPIPVKVNIEINFQLY